MPRIERTDDQLRRLEDLLRAPTVAAAVLLLGVLAVPVLDPGLSDGTASALRVTSTALYAFFVAEFALRLLVAPRRLAYVRRRPLDLLLVLVPFLRPLRLLQLGALAARLLGDGPGALHLRAALLVPLGAALAVVVGALSVLSVERGRGGPIDSVADAL